MWMGEEIETLADLLPAQPRAVCIGVNPAPRSVAIGHYYQGGQGQRFWARLRQAEVLPQHPPSGYEDDAAVAAGIGFTDVIKRPTARAAEVTAAERRFGAARLRQTLEAVDAPVLIFPFKAAAVALVGAFSGNGWLSTRVAGAELFVMPGPYEAKGTAGTTLASLARRLG